MGPGGFMADDWPLVADAVTPWSPWVYANFAGHLHMDAEIEEAEDSLEVYIVDAVWDDEITVRVVEVWSTSEALSYHHELVVVPRDLP